MPQHLTVTLETNDTAIGTLRAAVDKTDKHWSMRGALEVLQGHLGPNKRGYVRSCLATVASSGTVTCDFSSIVDGTDDVTIAGTTLSVEAAPSGEAQFDGGTTDATLAANLTTAINGNSTINKLVWARDDGASIVTITCVYPGPIGNLVALAESGNGFTISGALLTAGASDEVDTYALGYDPTL